jgi:phosphatidylglycerophosphate synthase
MTDRKSMHNSSASPYTKMESEKKDLDAPVRILRKLSVRLADLSYRHKIKPNQITLFRFFALGIGAAACLFLGGYLLNVIALILLFLGFIADLVDGDLARRHNLTSALGAALEENLDGILLNLLILAISLNLYLHTSPFAWAGFVCLFAQIFSRHYTNLFKERFQIDCVEGNPIFDKVRDAKDCDWFTRLCADLIAPKRVIYSLFSNFRYYLIVGVLINKLPESLLIYTVMINLRWLILLGLMIKYASRSSHESQYQIFQTLERLETHRQ